MSQVSNKLLKILDKLFELIQNEVQWSKSHLNFFLPEEAAAFGNNTEKKPQKQRPKLIIYNIYMFIAVWEIYISKSRSGNIYLKNRSDNNKREYKKQRDYCVSLLQKTKTIMGTWMKKILLTISNFGEL